MVFLWSDNLVYIDCKDKMSQEILPNTHNTLKQTIKHHHPLSIGFRIRIGYYSICICKRERGSAATPKVYQLRHQNQLESAPAAAPNLRHRTKKQKNLIDSLGT